MTRITFSIGLALLIVFGLVISLTPNPIMAADVLPQTPGAVLNSEGDEWVEVDPLQKEPTPPAPELTTQNESEQLPLVIPAAVLPGPEVALWEWRWTRLVKQGPEAVLAFVASQPDPNLPLLVAAAGDAQNELIAPQAPVSGGKITANWVAVNSGPCVYSSIQAAIDAAPSGASLLAASGTYIESFDVSGGKVLDHHRWL